MADNLARDYVGLAHAIEQYLPGYIDGYYGPDEWKIQEKRPLPELQRDAEALTGAVAALEEAGRRTFLEKQLRAMRATLALLAGEQTFLPRGGAPALRCGGGARPRGAL